MPDFSIVTIIKGRRKQLTNLLDSVKASTILPADVQIVCMDNPDGIEIPEGLNIKIHFIKNENHLPLAAARNLGIKATETNHIIFIDVDCIVSPTLFKTMLRNLKAENVITAYPLYLRTVPDNGIYAELKKQAVPHPLREQIHAGKKVDHLQFWSLIFAIKKESFKKIGGFDESFTGYGAEDTDFAMSFNKAGIDLIFAQDYILHQYHDKYDPPLNYFDSIIENAKRYKQKWDVLPMKRWLRAFEKLDLIKIDLDDNILIIQKPTKKNISESVSKNPY